VTLPLNKPDESEMDSVSQTLAHRVKELAERYENPIPQQANRLDDLEQEVTRHLERMGFLLK